MKPLANFDLELPFWESHRLVIGVDEVGRGALAGPVHVGAVAFHIHLSDNDITNILSLGIADSKLLQPKTREKLDPLIKQTSLTYSVQSADVETINKFGIVNAVEKAAYAAVRTILETLKPTNPIALVDGFIMKKLNGIIEQQAIIKGDQKSISIAAASIIAKVERDALMSSLEDENYYEWAVNKGYGTKIHREGIKKYGVHPLHRTLFIRKIAAQ
ncbi:ribonuclease HII [Candidatus Roizmanbacteria bacterium]|nr:ribonuclease HII [Candidatus Roizmanbacteria bacterium]